MATRKVPVTSVTPASKVKATSKAQQSRTRNLVMGIAAATPVGRAAKVATTAFKASNAAKTAKATKTLATPKSAVKVKPAAKPKPNKPNAAKTQFKNDSSRTRASDAAIKRAEKDEFSPAFRNTDPSYSSKLGERAGLNTKLKRKPNLKAK